MHTNLRYNTEVERLEVVMKEYNLFSKYNLNQIGVFGSVARGEQANDIDILINEDIDYKRLIAFRDELEKLLDKKVDIVIQKYANPIVLYRARKEIIYVGKH